MSFTQKIVTKLFPRAVEEIRRDYAAKISSAEESARKAARSELLEALGFEQINDRSVVNTPEGTNKYIFGYTWFLKGDQIVGIHPHDLVVLERVRKYYLKDRSQFKRTDYKDPHWGDFDPLDEVEGTYNVGEFEIPDVVISLPLKKGEKFEFNTELMGGKYTPQSARWSEFKYIVKEVKEEV